MISKCLALVFALCTFATANAQFILQPKWQPGSVEQLEYIHSKHKTELNETPINDTVYARISSKYIREDKDAHYFEWTYNSYYDNGDTAEGLLPSVLNTTFTKFLTTAYVRFSMSKTDGEVTILNQEELDSLQEVIIVKVVDSIEQLEHPDYYKLMGLTFKFESQLTERLHNVISSYYQVYTVEDIQLNKKRSIEEAGQSMLAKLDEVADSYDGYGLFDDTETNNYHLKMYLKADVSKSMNMLGEMADLLQALKDELNGKETDKVKKDSDAPSFKSYINTELEVRLDKAPMNVNYFKQTENTDASGTTLKLKDDVLTIIRRVQ